MKKTFLLMAVLFCMLCTFLACQKTGLSDEPPGNQYPPVFSSQQEAGEALRHFFLQAGQGEQLVRVENILFLEWQNKSYALVYYQSSFGNSNILYEQEYQNGVATTGKTYKCSGSACNCLVQTHISESGDVSFDCSCSSCSMIVNNF